MKKSRTLFVLILGFLMLSMSLSIWAGGYSSRNGGSSSRSYSSSPSGSGGRNTGVSRAANGSSSKKPYTSNSASASSDLLFSKPYNAGIQKQYAQQAAKKSYGAYQQSLPVKPKVLSNADLEKYRKRFSANETARKVGRDPNAWSARNQYYQSHQPMMAQGGSDSFGLLSGVFLYSLLSDSSHAGQYAYHHQNDEDYLKWRAEADKLAKDNAELKAKLDQLDADKSTRTGQIDPNWLPEGVPAAAVLSEEAIKSSQPDFRVCVGNESSPYYKVAQTNLLPNLADIVNLIPVITQGTPDIIDKLNSDVCDAGFIQGDATMDEAHFSTLIKPFVEAGHLVCNREVKATQVNDLVQLKTPIWMPKQSGSRMTWDQLLAANPTFKSIPIRDAVNYEEAILESRRHAACLFYMAAPNSAYMDKMINRPELKLLSIGSDVLPESVGYQLKSLSSSYYSNIVDAHWFMKGSISTLSIPANFVLSRAWRSTHHDLSTKVTLKMMDIQAEIKQSLNQ